MLWMNTYGRGLQITLVTLVILWISGIVAGTTGNGLQLFSCLCIMLISKTLVVPYFEDNGSWYNFHPLFTYTSQQNSYKPFSNLAMYNERELIDK